MVISLRPIAQMTVFMTFIIFTGAFLNHWIFGPKYISAELPHVVLRAINSSLYFAAYGAGIFFLLANTAIARTVLRDLNFFLAFAFLGLASIAWSLSPALAVVESGQLILTILTAAGLVAGLPFRDFIKAGAWSLLIMMVMSLVYIFFIPSYGIMDAGPYSDLTGVPQGAFRHKNPFGQGAVIGVIFAVASRGILSNRLRLALLASSVPCLILSSSVTNMLACVIGLSAFYYWQLMDRLRYGRAFSVASILVLSVVLLIVLPIILEAILGILGRDTTLTGRTVLWDYVFDLISKRPILGYGIASIWHLNLGDIPALPFFKPINAHNLFMEVTLQLGIVGLFITLLALGKVAFQLATNRNVTSGPYRLLFLVFAYSIVDAMAEYPIMDGNKFIFVLLLACIGYQAVEQAHVRAHGRDPRVASHGGEMPVMAG